MIIEYRFSENKGGTFDINRSVVKRTYKDVTRFETTQAGLVVLYGTKKFAEGTQEPVPLSYRGLYSMDFIITIVNLAPGEYLERVDVPRD